MPAYTVKSINRQKSWKGKYGDMVSDHRELRHEISPPLSDYHEDRIEELRAEAKRIQDDREFYRRQEAA